MLGDAMGRCGGWLAKRTKRSAKWRPARRGFEPLEDRLALSVTVTYHGGSLANSGPVLTHVEVSTIFYGSAWNSDASLRQNAQKLNDYYRYLVQSPYMDMLGEYYQDVPIFGREYIGRGSFVTSYTLTNPPAQVTDEHIQAVLGNLIDNHSIPLPNDFQTVYVIYLPPSVTSTVLPPGTAGYHASFNKYLYTDNQGVRHVANVTYAVLPYSNEYAVGSDNAFMNQTIIGSHELAEAVTDPGNNIDHDNPVGTAWYADGGYFADGHGREIADLAQAENLKIGKLNGYWVEAVWSNTRTQDAPDDHRILPNGVTERYATGNGRGEFNSTVGSSLFDEEDPLANRLPFSAYPGNYHVLPGQSLAVGAQDGLKHGTFSTTGLPLRFRLSSAPAHGSMLLAEDGSFQYQPDGGFTGVEVFTFIASDGIFESNPLTETIAVYDGVPAALFGGGFWNVVAGGSFDGGPVFQVFDQNSNPLPNFPVGLSVADGDAFAPFSGERAFTIATDANGNVNVPVLRVGTRAGQYTIEARVAGVNQVRTLVLTVAPDAPVRLVPIGATEQTAPVGQSFAPLKAMLVDQYGNPVADRTIHFDVVGNTAAADFHLQAPGVGEVVTRSLDVNADSQGMVSTAASFGNPTMLVANTTAGPFQVIASPFPLTFDLFNSAAAAQLEAWSGAIQTTVIGTEFHDRFKARALDSLGRPVQNVAVTFQAPAGDSGAFDGRKTVVAPTDADGIATAPIFRADMQTGSFAVTASAAGGADPATFNATAAAPPPPPTSLADSYLLGPGAAVASASVLNNDASALGYSLAAGIIQAPAAGTVTFGTDGTFSYAPGADFKGIDSFIYAAGNGFFSSPPTTVTLLSHTAAIVQKLYNQVLRRDPDMGGWRYWIGEIDRGAASLGTIATGFFESQERLDPIVAQMYRDYLFREADSSGLAYWRGEWQRDGGPENVIAGIVSSPEFFASAGGTNRLWVTEMYRRLLAREPDPQGLDFWTGHLDADTRSREQVVLGFVLSEENFRILVRGWHLQYLSRDANTDEEDQYTMQLQARASQRDIQIQLLNSAEYFNSPAPASAGTARKL